MKMTKRIFSILLACLMLMSMLSVGVFAATGAPNDPINANEKWFGYGVDTFLLNPALSAGDTDGIWYALTADKDGILQLDHSYKDVDYYIYAWVNNVEYSSYLDGAYCRPVTTLPVSVGDVITIQVIAQDTSLGGTVYLNAKFIDGSYELNQTVKVKATPTKMYVAAGQTVYFQDDSLNADYATQYVVLQGDSMAGVTFCTAVTNSNTGVVSIQKSYTDIDGDNTIETKLGGSLGSAGAPPIKPAWVIMNESTEDKCFVLSVVADAHECVGTFISASDLGNSQHTSTYTCSTCAEEYYVDEPHADTDNDWVCDACGKKLCNHQSGEPWYYGGNVNGQHTAVYDCALCGETMHTEMKPCYGGNATCMNPAQCEVCGLNYGASDPDAHVYDNNIDADCNECGAVRVVVCEHAYHFDCDTCCALCGEETRPEADHVSNLAACVDGWCIYGCGTAVPATADHNYECYFEQAPTCGNAGAYYYHCVCGDSYEEYPPATGAHTYAYDCDTVCAVCNEVTRPEAEHYYSFPCADGACEYGCGAYVPATADHNYECYFEQAPTCAQAGAYHYQCSLCGDTYETYPPATGEHTEEYTGASDNQDGTHTLYYNCCVCGMNPRNEIADHADEDHNGKCDACAALMAAEYDIVTFGGNSVTEDAESGYGLAFKFNAAVSGMTTNRNKAIYNSNVKVLLNDEYTLVGMGAVVSNIADGMTFTLEDVNNTSIIDIPAVYVFDVTENSVSYAVRVIDIPYYALHREISARPYYIYADADGNEIVVYADAQFASYNGNNG